MATSIRAEPGEGVEEELERSIDTRGTTPATDKQVHGDQAELEEDEKEHQIERQKDADHRCLQEQHQHKVESHLLMHVEIAEVDSNRHEQGRQQHQKEADAINAHDVVDAQFGEPGRVLPGTACQLGCCPSRPKAAGSPQR